MLNRLLLAVLLFLPAEALAAGFEIPDNGTQALGRGGAFTAVADDGSAIEYNPAGLTQQKGLSLTIDSNFINHHVSFLRTTPDGTNDSVPIQEVHNSAGTFISPLAAISYGRSFLPLDAFAVAVGFYTPSAEGKYVFPTPGNDPAADAPNRYQLIQNNIVIVYPTISVAYKLPLPIYAAIGVSGEMVVSSFEFDQDLYAQPSTATALGTQPGPNGKSPGVGGIYRGPGVAGTAKCPATYDPNCHETATFGRPSASPTALRLEDPIWDANVDVNVTGKKAFTAVLGALVKFGPVALGASYRPGYALHADGTLKVNLPGILTADTPENSPNGPSSTLGAKATVTGDQASLDFKWPSVFRAGADVAVPVVPGHFDISADYTYETWSVVDNFVLTPHNMSITALSGTTTVAPVIIPKHMQNSQSFRGGMQWELPVPVVKLQTRLGGYYEKSAIPEDYTTIDLAHFDRFAVTGGARMGINVGDIVGPLMLDLGVLYSPPVTREVRDSAVPLAASDPFLATDAVGNGNYTSSVLIISAGIRAHFGI